MVVIVQVILCVCVVCVYIYIYIMVAYVIPSKNHVYYLYIKCNSLYFNFMLTVHIVVTTYIRNHACRTYKEMKKIYNSQ